MTADPLIPIVDLAKVRFSHTHAGIRVIGTWYYDVQTRDHEPCLVLLDASRPVRRGRVIPVVVPLREAWRWALHDGVGDPIHCARSADEWMAAGLLPGEPGNRRDRLRILNAIDSRLRDLLLMPPRPAGGLKSLATVSILDPDTGRVLHEEDYKADV
jgi:hypothetical protein